MKHMSLDTSIDDSSDLYSLASFKKDAILFDQLMMWTVVCDAGSVWGRRCGDFSKIKVFLQQGQMALAVPQKGAALTIKRLDSKIQEQVTD